MVDESQPTGRGGSLSGLAARARRAAQTLKQEYEAGKRGDDAPAAPIWATPSEQLDAAVQLVRRASERVTGGTADGASPAPPSSSVTEAPTTVDTPNPVPEDLDAEADEVAGELRRVDWARVRAATADRSSDAARAARTLAAQVDWDRVQPAARRLSTALIGAVATGQLGIAGPIGPLVARAIVDQGGFGQRVDDRFEGQPDAPPADFGGFIETTAREDITGGER